MASGNNGSTVSSALVHPQGTNSTLFDTSGLLLHRKRRNVEPFSVVLEYFVKILCNPCGKGRRRTGVALLLVAVGTLVFFAVFGTTSDYTRSSLWNIVFGLLCFYVFVECMGCLCVLSALGRHEEEELELGNRRLNIRKDWEKGGEKQNRGGMLFAMFIQAVKDGQYDLVEQFLGEGQDPNGKDSQDGRMAIHWAAEKGYADIIQKLIEAESRLDKPEHIHLLTPLHLACFYGHVKAVELLIDHGAPLDPVNKNGLTPLELTEFTALDETTRQITHPQISDMLRHAMGETAQDIRKPKGDAAKLLDHPQVQAGPSVEDTSEDAARKMRLLEKGMKKNFRS